MKLLVIDGNSLINRAFYGIKLLTTKDGHFTNAVYGFINMLNRIMESENPDGVAVAFDLHAPTFRHKMYAEYKAGRKGMPPELAEQMPILKDWLQKMGYSVLSAEGFEADDILGTLARAAELSNNECIIATGDRDSFQLVSEKVNVLNTVTKMGKPEIIRYDKSAIFEKYGVEPLGMIEIKALQGDASDNIPGVPGVGEKTAQSLISAYGNIDYIYEHIDELEIKEGVRNKLIAGKASAFLSRELGTISREAPVSVNIEDYRTKPCDTKAVVSLMAKLEFFSLIKKMGLSDVPVELPETPPEKAIYKFAPAAQILEDCELLQMLFDYREEQLCICSGNRLAVLSFDTDGDLINQILLANNYAKSVYDCKSAHRFALQRGVELHNICFDTMIAGYLCSPSASSYEISRLAQEYGAQVPEFEDESNSSDFANFGALQAETAKVLAVEIEKNNFTALLSDIELPLAEVLADMELRGFSIDTDGIKQMGKRLESELKTLEARIYESAGTEFNINSPKQLGEILFVRLMLPCKKKTKSGYSTNAEVLEFLQDEHPIVADILEYRKLMKLKSTYCDGLVACADSSGKVHSTLNQTETRTGRISSTEPNLQNIPVRTEVGRELRKYFKASEGYTLLDADYSQIELRVLAHMAHDEKMTEAFVNNVDIHAVTAAEVFKMPQSMVTPLMRSRAKAVNFGIVYGIGAFSLAKDIKVSRKEASDYINGYLETYSGVAKYMENVVTEAKENGYVSTMFSRRRYLPELTATNANIRSFGERVARNMPIQGTAADIIKIAMVRVYNRLKSENLDARLIMQIHDELIVESKEDIAQKVANILTEEMQNSCKLAVPLVADTHIGKTWYDAKG